MLYAARVATVLISLTVGAAEPQLFGAAMPTADRAAALWKMDPWSQAEAALTAQPRQRGSGLSRNRVDFFDALTRNRPNRVAGYANVGSYAASMSLREAATFKGFLFEHSLIRRWNAKPYGPRYRLSSTGHEYVDIERYDPITGKALQTLQAYGGANPKTALEKLLLSDRVADKLVVTKDVYQQIKITVGECEGLHRRMLAGELDANVGNRLISERAKKIGLQFDPQTGELYAQSKAHGRGSLGQLGTDETRQSIGKMVKDPLTSERVARLQFEALLDSDKNLYALRMRLGGNEFATRALQRLYEGKSEQLVRSGVRPGKAGRFATEWMQREHAPELLGKNVQSLQRAATYGVPETELDRVLVDMKEDVKRGASPLEAFGSADEKLRRLAANARRTQILRAQAVLAAFAVVGAGIDAATSDQELKDWLKSDRPMEWSARLGIGAAAVGIAGKAEMLVMDRLLKRGGQETAERFSKGFASRVVGGGAAAAIFIVGESAIAAIFHDASWGEVADHAYEAALVIAVSEGAVLGADFLVSAASGGSIGGPAGIAISVGAALLYEGGKYLWTSRRELESDRLVYLAKCDTARGKISRWASSVDVVVGSESK